MRAKLTKMTAISSATESARAGRCGSTPGDGRRLPVLRARPPRAGLHVAARDRARLVSVRGWWDGRTVEHQWGGGLHAPHGRLKPADPHHLPPCGVDPLR